MSPGSGPAGVRAQVEPVDAVTVILVRDAPAPAADQGHRSGSLEVLLLQRHGASAFAPGALVFPGGKLDPTDVSLPWERAPLPEPQAWTARLGVPDAERARAVLVAAVRETFEEAGVLLARHDDGTDLAARPLPDDELAALRHRMAARDGAHDWTTWLTERGIVLDLQALAMWSWWVTPAGLPRRFDTRFLIAHLPTGQAATHDAVETTAMRWIAPGAALAAYESGELHVIYPTRCTLEQLAGHVDAAAAVAAAREGAVDLRRIEPRVVHVDGTPMVQHPDGGPPAAV